jgi:hypothetical protein
MGKRKRHPKKDVEKALQLAEEKGWTVTETSSRRGHSWGRIVCPTGEHKAWVYSTPKNPGTHAKQIQKTVIRCPHEEDD